MIRRISLALLLAFMLASVAVPSASAAPGQSLPYPVSCGFILDPPVVQPDDSVHIIGSGFRPGSVVTFFIEGETIPEQILGTTRVDNDPDGNIDATFILPEEFATDGLFTITVNCPGTTDVASNAIIVGLGSPTTVTVVPISTVPNVGANSMGIAQMGGVLLGAGALLVLLARRRSESEVG